MAKGGGLSQDVRHFCFMAKIWVKWFELWRDFFLLSRSWNYQGSVSGDDDDDDDDSDDDDSDSETLEVQSLPPCFQTWSPASLDHVGW